MESHVSPCMQVGWFIKRGGDQFLEEGRSRKERRRKKKRERKERKKERENEKKGREKDREKEVGVPKVRTCWIKM